MIFLSGTYSVMLDSLADIVPVGLLLNPRTGLERRHRHEVFRYFAIDNGCFSASLKFEIHKYLGWLESLPRRALFAVAPDVLCDAAAALQRSALPLEAIRALGFKAALVAQNGLEACEVPWESFDALFIGGDTRWKLSRDAALLAIEARRRGKWVHMGRVNSERRLRHARTIGCHSVDGNFLRCAPDGNVERLDRWFRQHHLPFEASA